MPSKTLKTTEKKATQVKKPAVKVQAEKKTGLTIDVYDIKGKVKESMKLSEEVFGAKPNKQLLAQAVRVYLANQRRGTVSTKTRGEVAGSTRKIYRQKGTGRARHGGLRAPIFVHGGIAFGPKPRDYSLQFPKKMKKQALFTALSTIYKDGGVKVVEGLGKVSPKTKAMVEVLTNLNLQNSKKTLLVLPEKLAVVERVARNIEGVTITQATQLTTYDVLRAHTLLFMRESLDTLTHRFAEKE